MSNINVNVITKGKKSMVVNENDLDHWLDDGWKKSKSKPVADTPEEAPEESNEEASEEAPEESNEEASEEGK